MCGWRFGGAHRRGGYAFYRYHAMAASGCPGGGGGFEAAAGSRRWGDGARRPAAPAAAGDVHTLLDAAGDLPGVHGDGRGTARSNVGVAVWGDIAVGRAYQRVDLLPRLTGRRGCPVDRSKFTPATRADPVPGTGWVRVRDR